MPKVFISYSHDSEEVENEVKELADKLRNMGILTEIDQYTTNPSQGWPQYMMENVLSSDFILCVCTETYKKRFENTEKIGVGLGAKFEGKYITQILYSGEYNKKVIPIMFEDTNSVPFVLQPYTHYRLYEKGEFEELYRYITNQPFVEKPEVGSIISLKPGIRSELEDIVFTNDNKLKKKSKS